jgi:hypothetical protein
MAKRLSKKAAAEKAVVISTIYNVSTKSKAELRAESEKALKAFLRAGGEVQVGRKLRARKGGKMAAKSSKGFQSGTSGFANGFPRASTAFSK